MGFPELDSDEPVILQAHNIKVKSVVFEAVLTNKRLVLVDDKKGLIPPQEILISTIKTVDGGENPIRDPILTFTILSSEGTARQMILTFPRMASGERRRERDDWLKALTAVITSFENSPVIPDATAFDQPPAQSPLITSPYHAAGLSSPKKKIDITRPKRNIIESVPVMPRPVETTSLPVGLFCSRCGNRVPPESAFCNRCGTAVTNSEEKLADPSTFTAPAPAAVPSTVPQVQVSTPPVFGQGGDRKERTLEEVIHSIEPLIEDSKPRSSEPVPLVPRHYPAPAQAVDTPAVEVPPSDAVPADPSAEPLPGESAPGETPPLTPPSQPPLAVPSKKPKLAIIAVLAIVILAVIGAMVIFPNLPGTAPNDTVITPAITTVPATAAIATPKPTVTLQVIPTTASEPEVVIPKTGVWLRITYLGKFSGSYGTPGSQYTTGERNTGDQFFTIPTVNGPVVASIQKMDGSSGTLTLEVYKNGELMKRTTTVSPKGIIDLQVDLKPKPTPTPVPVQTVNATGTA